MDKEPAKSMDTGIMEITSTPQLDAELEGIRKRCEAATLGPWIRIDDEPVHEDYDVFSSTKMMMGGNPCPVAKFEWDEDEAFCIHARTDVPRLLEIVQQQRQEIERLKVGCEKYLDELNFERGLWDKSEVEYQAESQQLRERVAELEVAMQTVDKEASIAYTAIWLAPKKAVLHSDKQKDSANSAILRLHKAARTALARKGE